MRPSGCCSGYLPASGSRACSPAVDGSAPTPPTCWRRCGSPDRLELVTETLRAALEALAVVAPGWLHGFLPDQWYARYGQRARDWRLPKAEAAREALAVTVGIDGFALLQAIHAAEAPSWLREVPAVQTLRAVWVQQYYRDRQGLRWRSKSELPPGALAIGSPYASEARYGIKRGVGWRGYKAHLTETCEPTGPT